MNNINKVKIFVNTIEYGIIELLVRNNENIKEIKENIYVKIGLNVNLLNLYYNGKILEDDKTLNNYEIINNSVINIVNKLRGGMRIFVENNQKIFAFEIEENEKINNAKLKIFESLRIDDNYFYLVYNDKIFDGYTSLIKYGISNKSLINVVSKEIKILAKFEDGEMNKISLHKIMKIIDIKNKIQEKTGLHPDGQQLIYQNKILYGNKIIGKYEISENSVINVVNRLRGEMIIFAKTMDGKSIAFGIKISDKIIDIKKKIQDAIGLHPDEQRLIYQGGVLEDDRIIDEYRIYDQSVINIMHRGGMQIIAQTMDGKTVALEVQNTNKIIDIQYKIQEKLGLHPDEQKLVYRGGIFMEDNKTIDEYGIFEKSVINVIVRLRGGMQIFAKIINGETFAFEAQKTERIIDIKYKIQYKIGLSPDEYKLVYQGEILEDDKTIDDYQIADKSVITVVIRPRGGMIIYAKTMEGKTVAIEVKKTNRIIDIKYKIQYKIGLHRDRQQLVYQDEILEDNKMIGQYEKISKYSTIDVLQDEIQIFIKTIDGETLQFEIKKSDKIIDIKNKFIEKLKLYRNEELLKYYVEIFENELQIRINELQTGSNLDKQILIYNNVILEDDKTIDEYQICENSVINIINKSKIEIMINLEIFDGRKFKLCAEKQTKIIDIKKQIEMLIDLYPIKQNLYYQDILLDENENTLEKIQTLGKRGKFSTMKSFIKKLFIPEKRNCSIIEMKISVELSNDWMEIFVETTNQIQYKLCVKKYETIFDVKNQIRKVVNVEPNEQILFYNELILENNKTVEQSNIVEKSVLRVEFNLTKWINIYMNILNGNRNMGKLDLMTTHKLRYLKCDIEEKIGINRDAQILMYNGEILLDDDKTVNQYQITNNSIIDIKLRNEYTITCDEDDYLKMGDTKKVIKNKTQINKEQKIVIYSSNFNNNKLIFEYEIKNKEKRKVNCKLKKFIEAIKSESIDDVQMYYEKSLLEMKYGSYFRHPIHYACKLGIRDIVKYLIEKGCNLEAADSENRRPIHYVCAAGNVELLNILIQHNVNIEASDLLNRRPIHIACFKENLNIITKLIEKKCDQEACDYQNRRPIHYSCTNGNVEIIEFLIENNCDIESADNSNRSPLMIAQENNSEVIVEILYKEMRTRRNIRMVADAMKLECAGDDCDHKFCRTFMLNKKFKGELINKGAYGKVYLCNQSKTSAHFVYKKFDNDSISSKYIEGNINDFIDKIKHEKIIEYVGGFEIKKNKFIFMEYVKEGSLQDRIKKPNITLIEIIGYTKQILEALQFLHGNDIIHRDIKPDNAVVDGNENVKLIDFGFSLPLSKVGNEIQQTATYCGTQHYMAPEILNGELYSCSVDIWSLGITVIEMAKGKIPQSINTYAFIVEIMKTRTVKYELPDSLEHSNDLEFLINKMLHPDGSKRSSATGLLYEFSYVFPDHLYKQY